jgi:hypothetical protein
MKLIGRIRRLRTGWVDKSSKTELGISRGCSHFPLRLYLNNAVNLKRFYKKDDISTPC